MGLDTRELGTVGPWAGAALAALVALVLSGGARLLRWPALASVGSGIGFAAGCVWVLDGLTASPRQLPERLPLLAVAGAIVSLCIAMLGRGRIAWLAAAVAAVAAAWWLGGAPLVRADAVRALLPLLALALLASLLVLTLDGPLPGAVAAVLLCAGLWLTAPFGPWLVLGAVLAASAAAGLLGPAAWGPGARLAPALGLTALAAGPVLARGTAADWLAAALAPALLLAAGPLGARLLGRPDRGADAGRVGLADLAGWLVVAGAMLALIWLAKRG